MAKPLDKQAPTDTPPDGLAAFAEELRELSRQRLRDGEPDPGLTPEAIADMVWFLSRLLGDAAPRMQSAARDQAEPPKLTKSSPLEPEREPDPDPPLSSSSPLADSYTEPVEGETESRREQVEAPPDTSAEPETPVFAANQPVDSNATGSLPLSPFRVPGVAPLPDALALSRALRPLRRTIPSRRRFALDIEATVQRIADEQRWDPALVPVPERWLDLDLIVDDARAMQLWRPAIAALNKLLLREDAFHTIRSLRLRCFGEAEHEHDRWQLVDAAGRVRAKVPPKDNPRRERVVWLLTDGIDDDWLPEHPARLAAARLSRHAALTLLQPLPRRLWFETALGLGAWLVGLRSARPAARNRQLLPERDQAVATRLLLPSITFEPFTWRDWTTLTLAQPGALCAGLSVDAPPPRDHDQSTAEQEATSDVGEADPQDDAPDDPAALLAEFREHASPEAYRLACHLAALPLNLAVMRLAQQQIVGNAGHLGQLAEIFFGGILERMDMSLPESQRETVPERIPFDFIGDIRSRLLDELRPSQVQAVFERIRTLIQERFGSVTDFAGLFLDPGAAPKAVDRRTYMLAKVHLSIFRRIGGDALREVPRLAAAVRAFEERIGLVPAGASKLTTDVLLVSRDRVTAHALLEIYRERSGFEPLTLNEAGYGWHDLGTLRRNRVLHLDLSGAETWDEAQLATRDAHNAVQASTVIELGLAELVAFETQQVGELFIADAMHDGTSLGDRVQQASPLLREAIDVAQASWPVAAPRRGVLWFSEFGQEEWETREPDTAIEQRPSMADACLTRGQRWIALRGLVQPRRRGYRADYLDASTPDAVAAATRVSHFVLHLLERVPLGPTPFKDNNPEGYPGGAPAPDMIWLPGGDFTMGSLEGIGRNAERPAHRVRLDHYAVGKTPITVGEFRRFVEATGFETQAEQGDGVFVWNRGDLGQKDDASWSNPYMDQDDNHPVTCVSWNDAMAYCEWLSERTGQQYGLLTEAQWEHACRAGSESRWCFGDEEGKLGEYAWYSANAGHGTHPVATKEPNGFGLHDMHGNVWEWCADRYARDTYAQRVEPALRTESEQSVSGKEPHSGPYSPRGVATGESASEHPVRASGATSAASGTGHSASDTGNAASVTGTLASDAGRIASDNPSGSGTGSNRVIRGGSWGYGADDCRSAYRDFRLPSFRHVILGFRLSRTGPLSSYPFTLGRDESEPRAQALEKPGAEPRSGGSVRQPEPPRPGRAATPETGCFRDQFVILRKDGREERLETPEMIYLPGGTFLMGDEQGSEREKPVHSVRVSPFAMGRTPVTWGEYRLFCEDQDKHWPEWLDQGSAHHLDSGRNDWYQRCGVARDADTLPVVGVSWTDAMAYCAWLAERSGKGYRLSSEAEWEYACRGGVADGQRTRWSCGDNEADLERYAWYFQNAGGKLHPVAEKAPNPFGLHDMHGNVWEWCRDGLRQYSVNLQDGLSHSAGNASGVLSQNMDKRVEASEPLANPVGPDDAGSYRVLRGGSWGNVADYCRSAVRNVRRPSDRYDDLGFRLSRTV